MKFSKDTSPAFRIYMMYGVVASGWILFSDRVLAGMGLPNDIYLLMQSAKGWFFVFVTSALLYFFIRKSFKNITDSNRAATNSNNFLEAIITVVNEPVYVRDDNQVLLIVNNALCVLLEQSKDELIGKTAYENIPKEQNDEFSYDNKCVLDSGACTVVEENILLDSGKTITVIAKKTRYVDAEGNKFIVGVLNDITEKRRKDLEILRLAKFTSENPSPVLRITNDGILTHANKASEDFVKSMEISIGDKVPVKYLALVFRTVNENEVIKFEVSVGQSIYEYSSVPIEGEEYINFYGADITEQKNFEIKLTELATKDAMTGIYNRRMFIELAQNEFERTKRFHRPTALLMLDLDHFKLINDSYGHDVGDKVLVAFTKECSRGLRAIDSFGRVGGEEFAILLPETEEYSAAQVAERLRSSVEHIAVKVGEEFVKFTVSIGYAVSGGPNTSYDLLSKQADDALYVAKRNGRNQVCSAFDCLEPTP